MPVGFIDPANGRSCPGVGTNRQSSCLMKEGAMRPEPALLRYMPSRNRPAPARGKAPTRPTKHAFRRRRATFIAALLASATLAVVGGAVVWQTAQRAASGATRGPSFTSVWSALTSTLAADERTRIDSSPTAIDTSRKSTGDPRLVNAAPTATPKLRHDPEPEPIESDAAVARALPLKRTIEQVLDEGVDLIRDYRLPASIQLRASSCGD